MKTLLSWWKVAKVVSNEGVNVEAVKDVKDVEFLRKVLNLGDFGKEQMSNRDIVKILNEQLGRVLIPMSFQKKKKPV